MYAGKEWETKLELGSKGFKRNDTESLFCQHATACRRNLTSVRCCYLYDLVCVTTCYDSSSSNAPCAWNTYASRFQGGSTEVWCLFLGTLGMQWESWGIRIDRDRPSSNLWTSGDFGQCGDLSQFRCHYHGSQLWCRMQWRYDQSDWPAWVSPCIQWFNVIHAVDIFDILYTTTFWL